MPSKTVSVVIPTWNKRGSLSRTLDSLERICLPGAEFEVIVVDDASTDDTWEWLGNYRPGFPMLRLRNDRNDGPATTRNRGSLRAQGEVLLFLDDDMVCQPNLIEAHMVHHESGRDVAVVGRAIYHPQLKRSALTRYFDALHLRQVSPFCPTSRLASNNLSLPRTLFERAGMFDETFPSVGFEDVDLAVRLARISGCSIRYEPRAWAYHYHDQSLRDYIRKLEAAGERNFGIFASKYPIEVDLGALGWLVAGRMNAWRKQAVRAILSLPGATTILIPVAEIAPGYRLNSILVKYLLASSMLRGYRRRLSSSSRLRPRDDAKRLPAAGEPGSSARRLRI